MRRQEPLLIQSPRGDIWEILFKKDSKIHRVLYTSLSEPREDVPSKLYINSSKYLYGITIDNDGMLNIAVERRR